MLKLFRKGCEVYGGEVVEQRDGLVCILDDVDERIKLHKSGRWVKAYVYDPDVVATKLQTWAKPESITVKDGGFEIAIKGAPPIEVEKVCEELSVNYDAPHYIDPQLEREDWFW